MLDAVLARHVRELAERRQRLGGAHRISVRFPVAATPPRTGSSRPGPAGGSPARSPGRRSRRRRRAPSRHRRSSRRRVPLHRICVRSVHAPIMTEGCHGRSPTDRYGRTTDDDRTGHRARRPRVHTGRRGRQPPRHPRRGASRRRDAVGGDHARLLRDDLRRRARRRRAVGVRIFTPAGELPFAGHPLVGATWHLATPGAGVALRCGIGVVAGHRPDDDTASIEVAYLPSVERTTLPGVVASWIAHMPLPYEVHPARQPRRRRRLRARRSARPPPRLGTGDEAADDTVRARFFAPGMGVDEDPATGSAAVALAAVLRHEGERSAPLTIHQGAEIGIRRASICRGRHVTP